MEQRDRISELPADIIDQILGFLPIDQAARMAVLSTFWRDIWFSLTKLNFDHEFCGHIQRKYCHVYSDIGTKNSLEEKKNDDIWSATLYVISKVLNQHNGLIRTFVIDFKTIYMLRHMHRSRSFDLDQWFLFVTRKGVEEIHLKFVEYISDDDYRLPNCIFSCPTLKKLHLYGVSVGTINAHCTLPNVTSLCLEYVDFNGGDQTVEVPKLENLSFMGCNNMTNFNTSAQKLDSLAINGCRFCQLPVNLELSSIRTLDLDSYAVQDFVNGFTRRGLQLEPSALNVEYFMLSENRSSIDDDFTGDISSAFIHLLRICPKLFKLDIDLWFYDYEFLPKLFEEFHTVAQGHQMLYALKLTEFLPCEHHVVFIKRLLACFPALEKVVIIHSKILFVFHKDVKKLEDELLHSPCASTKAEIIICNV